MDKIAIPANISPKMFKVITGHRVYYKDKTKKGHSLKLGAGLAFDKANKIRSELVEKYSNIKIKIIPSRYHNYWSEPEGFTLRVIVFNNQ